jgi:hypothetical protein
MSEFGQFLWAVLNNWAGYATSGLIVASASLYFVARDKPMPKKIGFVLAALFLLMAFFKAWKDQKDAVDVENSKNEQQLLANGRLQKQLDDLTKSNISGRIDWAVMGEQPNDGSHVGVILSLSNSGASSSIDPGSWTLTAVTQDGRSYSGYANTLLNKNLDFCFGGTHVRRFVREDALDRKSSVPIPTNGTVQGFLWFGFPNLKKTNLEDNRTSIIVGATSIAGQVIKASVTVAELREKAQRTTHFPGIENPRLLAMPCKDNVAH